MNNIPPLSPPENDPTSTTPQSIGDYSPVEHFVAYREHITAITPNLTTTPQTNDTTKNLGRDDSLANLLEKSSSSPLNDSKSYSSIATFDDDDKNASLSFNDSQIDDSDLFEHFNGSVRDLATHEEISTIDPVPTESIIAPPSSSPSTSSPASPTSPTLLTKTRKIPSTSRKITPLRPNLEEQLTTTALSERIAALEADLNTTETKHYKLEREIACVDDLLNKISDRHSVEFKKLNYAREKLEERLLTAKKDRYTIGIKLNKLRRKLYGDNGGDMTEYFARKVSI